MTSYSGDEVFSDERRDGWTWNATFQKWQRPYEEWADLDGALLGDLDL